LNNELRSNFVLSWEKMLQKRSKCLMKLMVSQLCLVLLYFGAMVSFHQMDSKIQNKEFVPPGSTVNVEFYKNVLDRLCKIIARVRPAL